MIVQNFRCCGFCKPSCIMVSYVCSLFVYEIRISDETLKPKTEFLKKRKIIYQFRGMNYTVKTSEGQYQVQQYKVAKVSRHRRRSTGTCGKVALWWRSPFFSRIAHRRSSQAQRRGLVFIIIIIDLSCWTLDSGPWDRQLIFSRIHRQVQKKPDPKKK